MPPRYRLACQCFVRNEDIVVAFEGDETLPAAGAAHHARRQALQGRHGDRRRVDEFHGYAVKVEEDAALHFDELASGDGARAATTRSPNCSRQLAGFSRLQLAEAQSARRGARRRQGHAAGLRLARSATPERTALWAGDPSLSRLDALRAALQGERRGYEFYCRGRAPTRKPGGRRGGARSSSRRRPST